MPRRKSDQVVTVRIEAGRWEREKLLKPIADIAGTANMIRSVGLAVGGVALVGGAYVAYLAVDSIWGVGQNVKDWWKDFKFIDLVTPTPFTDEEIAKQQARADRTGGRGYGDYAIPFWRGNMLSVMLFGQPDPKDYGISYTAPDWDAVYPDLAQMRRDAQPTEEYGVYGGQTGPPEAPNNA